MVWITINKDLLLKIDHERKEINTNFQVIEVLNARNANYMKHFSYFKNE